MTSNSEIRSRLPVWQSRDIAPLASLGLLVLFFSFATSSFTKPATLMQILSQGSVLAVVAAGLTFVLLCAEIDLAVGMLALWTACFCGWLFECPFAAGPGGENVAPIWAIAVTLAVPLASVCALGMLSGLLTVWSALPSFIITLAMMNIADGMSRYLTKSVKFEVPKLLETIGNHGIELTDRLMLPYSAIVAAVIMLLGHLVLAHTRFGRYVYMTGGNRQAARLAGVRCHAVVVGCLTISAATAGVGGLMNAGRLNSVSLDQNADLLLSAVACVVLGGTSLFGGVGGMGKTLIGVLTFSVLKVGLNQIDWIDDYARPLLMGAVLMVALVFNGLLGKEKP